MLDSHAQLEITEQDGRRSSMTSADARQVQGATGRAGGTVRHRGEHQEGHRAGRRGTRAHSHTQSQAAERRFRQAVSIAHAEPDQCQPKVVVASSSGGTVTMNVESGDVCLLLPCRAQEEVDRLSQRNRIRSTQFNDACPKGLPFQPPTKTPLHRNPGSPLPAIFDVQRRFRPSSSWAPPSSAGRRCRRFRLCL